MAERGNPKLNRLRGTIESLSVAEIDQQIRATKSGLKKLHEERESVSCRIQAASDELVFWEQLHVLKEQTHPMVLAARRNGASPKRWGPTRKAIIEAMRLEGGELDWRPQQVWVALEASHPDVPLSVVQNTMFRMARSGQLLRRGRMYVLAPTERRALPD